jgi:glutathione S-transferase
MAGTLTKEAEASQKYLLLSIAVSHFNEKARWALSYYRVTYTHQLLLPWFHIFSTKPIVDSQVCNCEPRDSGSSPFSTPCLAVYDASGKNIQESFHDSHDILVHLSSKFSTPEHPNLYTSCGPEKEEHIYVLEKHYDEVIGKAVVNFCYLDLLAINKWKGMIPFACMGFRNRVGLLQSLAWFGLSPLLGRMITSVLGITPDRHPKAMEICREEFRVASEGKSCLCSTIRRAIHPASMYNTGI